MNKLIKLIFVIFFYANYYCSACAVEEGVYALSRSGHVHAGCGGKYGSTGYFYLEAQPDDNTVKSSTWCTPMNPETSLAPRTYLWSVESTNDGEHYKICSDTKMGIKCLEADPNLEGRSLIKVGSPSSHENQLWSIKPFGDGYSICSDILPFEVRCLVIDGQALKVGSYQAWHLEETYYRLNNLEISDKQKNIRLMMLEKTGEQQANKLIKFSNRLNNLEKFNEQLSLEQKLDELKRTTEQQANDLIKFSNRLSNLEKLNEQVNLFCSSFVSGATYSLIPEVIKDGIEFSGYPKKAANVAAMVAQGAMVAYNTVDPLNPSSYASTITGMAARYGSVYLGYSNDTSIIVGSTAAVVTTILFAPEETTLDCITGCAIALAGSYAGSTLALKAKSWIYEFWNNGGSSVASQAASWVSQARSWSYGFWGNTSNQPDTATVSALQRTISEQEQRIKDLESRNLLKRD